MPHLISQMYFTQHNIWRCAVCNKGPTYYHRRCLSRGYHFNGSAWESDSLKNGKEQATKECLSLSSPVNDSSMWIRRPNKQVFLPPGTYYIGYPDFKHPLPGEDGCYTNGESAFVLGKTTHNYRTFIGSNGSSYEVENGLLGIFTTDLIRNVNTGSFHTFTDLVEVQMDDPGVFKFISTNLKLTIDTRHAETF